ncbi:MAG: hypothetical protein IJW92_04570 [Clostridia bacterium]|nr:hypothetical protein [Clostridia bacterium]
MKRKFTLVLAACLVLTALLCGCSLFEEKAEVFTSGNMSITLTNRFSESDQEGCEAIYSSLEGKVVVVIKETFDDLRDLGCDESSTASDYARLVIDVHEMSDTAVKEKDGVTYYTYESDVDGVSYSYLATVHKSGDAFWLIQFASTTENYAKFEETFFTYAKSVQFS